SLKLSQKLVMTPSLQQAIKLLQMTRMELETLLSQELVENPVLEDLTEGQEEEVEEEQTPKEEEPPPPANGSDVIDHAQSMDNIDFDAYFGDEYDSSYEPSMREEREGAPIENSLTREGDIYDHLVWQLHMGDFTPRQVEIGELIIGNLDADGFLVATPEEIQGMGDDLESEPYTLAEVEEALAIVRRFDPPGIACANLRESLLLQLDLQGEACDALARRVIEEAWEPFLRRQFPVVAKKLGIEL